MKKSIITLTATSILLSTPCFADTLKFSWEYSNTEQANITGFRIYRDNGSTIETELPPEARIAVIPRQTDKKTHAYYIVAYKDNEKSEPSDIAIDNYVAVTIKPVVNGSLSIEIIKD